MNGGWWAKSPGAYGGMTVNERLSAAGLRKAYDAAVAKGDRDEIDQILARIGLRQDASGMNWSNGARGELPDPEAREAARLRAQGKGYLLDAHAHTVRHRAELEASQAAACFSCCALFAPSEIQEWADDKDCAICPRCGVDAVIGDASGFAITEKTFLKEMNEFWF